MNKKLVGMLAMIAAVSVFGANVYAGNMYVHSQGTNVYIYSESFSGDSGDNLHGTAPDVRTGSETWIANSEIKADGSIGGSDTASAFLPFVPEPGNIYTLSATLDQPTDGSWAAIGFTDGSYTNTFWGTPNYAWPWMLWRTDDDIDAREGPGVDVGAEILGDYTGMQTLSIVLNTEESDWTAEWFIDGVSQHKITSFSHGNPTIGHIALGRNNDTVVNRFRSFSLEVAEVEEVPEMSVLEDGVEVAPSSTNDFGFVAIEDEVSRTFTVTNLTEATGDLILTNDPAVVFANGTTNQNGFTISQNITGGDTNIAAGASSDFTISFSTNVLGSYSATVQIASNDPEHDPYYSFDVTAEVLEDLTPEILTLSPTNNAVDAAIDATLIATFDQPIVIGSGEIVITNLTDATVTTIDVEDETQVSVSNANSLVIHPSSSLAYDTQYAVLMAAGVIVDFDGMADTSVWSFTTEAAPTFTVTFEPGEHGLLDGGDSNVVHVVAHGSDAPEAPTVTPDAGYAFTGWDPEIPATITDDFTTTAQYALKTYTVSFVTDGTPGASLTGDTNQVVSHGGSTDAVTANAPADHQFVSWTRADVVYTLDAEVVVTDVTEDQTLVANFVPNDAIAITAASAEKVYDGTALTTNGYSITSGELETGHTLVSVEVTGSQTLAGESANVATNAFIQDAELNDVTDTYTITYFNGALTVTPRPITIEADSDTKVYDGEPLTNSGYEITAGTLADGDSLDTVTVTGSQTDAGESANVPSAAVITNDSAEDVTTSYDITYANGTLTVTKTDSTITVTGESLYGYTGTGVGPDTANVDGSTGTITFSYEGTGETSYGPSADKPAAIGTYEVVASVEEDANHFGAQSDPFAFDIIRGTPTVTVWPTASDIIFGQSLSASTLSGGEASVGGTFAFTNPETVPEVGGIFSASVTFTPDEPENYTDVVGSVDVYVDASGILPFDEDFEALDLGDLDGQNGWEASGAIVQTNVVKSGEQAAAITDGDGYVRRTFVDEQTNVWTDFYMQPVFFDDPPSAIDPDATAVLYFNDDGHPVVYDGPESEVIASYTATGQWVRVTIEHDYAEKVWDLYLDGISRRTGLGFYNTDSTHYEEFNVSGAGSASAYLDDIQILLTSPLEDLIYYTLTVLSAHGTPDPEVGTTDYVAGATVHASVAGSPDVEEGVVKYEVTGWEGTGSGLTSGPGTNVSFNITEDTTLTWQWSTNYWVELIVEGE